MVEYWVHSCSIWLKNNTVHGINKPWIEKTSTVNIDPKSLDSNTEVMRFWPLFHCSLRAVGSTSRRPAFHHSISGRLYKEKCAMCKFKTNAFGLQIFAAIAFLICGTVFFSCAPTAVIGKPVDPAKLAEWTFKGSYRGGRIKRSSKWQLKIIRLSILK